MDLFIKYNFDQFLDVKTYEFKIKLKSWLTNTSNLYLTHYCASIIITITINIIITTTISTTISFVVTILKPSNFVTDILTTQKF